MQPMEKFLVVLKGLGLFLLFSAVLFIIQWQLAENNVVMLSYKIHFLMFFVTLISLLTILVVFALEKKNIIGFIFLGFVVFKIFAIGYVAMFEKDFELNIVPYFVLYWIYLLIEVIFVLKLVKKQD
ncbi:hypothetical protein SAMN05421682_102410 [Chryseobacterium indoltheticum]|uniref:Uncharacterized protein n=2 Tax=Chryseobacterium group TaxID=2782232 RepID=A0A381FGT9_9FLAO|nr:hypothetical protein SAMN05421682_102410 [Chryseobacterium indoltheticum]SUX45737.1 Uncharacterised protein [Chryseobacterium indoltheticum]